MNYNPNTKPVWLALMPTILGIAAVLLVIAGLVYGANQIKDALDGFNQMAGQYIGC